MRWKAKKVDCYKREDGWAEVCVCAHIKAYSKP